MLRIACFIQYIQHTPTYMLEFFRLFLTLNMGYQAQCKNTLHQIYFTILYRLIKKKISILSPEIQDIFLQIMRNNILLINLTVLLYLNHV